MIRTARSEFSTGSGAPAFLAQVIRTGISISHIVPRPIMTCIRVHKALMAELILLDDLII